MQIPVGLKRTIIASCDVLLVLLALCATLFILDHPLWPASDALLILFGITAALTVPALSAQRLYKAIIRFIGAEMHAKVLRGVAVIALCVAATAFLLQFTNSRSSLVIGLVFWTFASYLLGGVRVLMRALISEANGSGERVAIYGAGEAGRRLAAAVANSHELHPVLFVDDDPKLQGRLVAGIPVTDAAGLVELIAKERIQRILLALPSTSRHRRQQILMALEPLAVQVQTVPDIGDLVTGKARLDELRDVGVADILGRDPVAPVARLLDACIRGKCVMVTGAGGSIGSELCRQIIELGSTRLVLFEVSELALYQIERELRERIREHRLEVELIALLGSVNNRGRLRQVVQGFGVQTIYHAAAYKHVPIVEFNMAEGVRNNVIGTWHAAEAAAEAGVENFVLVSTDKAVRPTNVMGATKRVAELVLQGMTRRGTHTRFCMVRFGNVLESSGSVVPLFREQIRRGGPVTVTDPDVIRYFMTIPEAAQLVLQAGAMGQGGEVFVLDMGEPVRIAELARRMIQLMGLTVRDRDCPDGDIAIRFTGLRPGEKLYEELLIGGDVGATDHPKILCAHEGNLPWPRIQDALNTLMVAADDGDCDAIRRVLLDIVQGYQPIDRQIADLSWQHRPAVSPEPVVEAKIGVA
ncbi:MAG: polysaccharide biosynthesis protein [Gammaproteobacteria bacterium]|nr:polysaccharide biosynthesis protein [Gammaproteobacteria bacterium]